jgi:hypothetical protein
MMYLFIHGGQHMNKLLIRFSVVSLAVAGLMYGCGDSSDTPMEPSFTQSTIAQSECGEDQFLVALGPVLAAWEDSLETWQARGDILNTAPVFDEEGDVGDHIDELADVLTQWKTALNDTLVNAGLDSVATFDPDTTSQQVYLTGLSTMLGSWRTDLDTAHGSAFLPAPPVFAADVTAPVIVCPGDTVITCATSETVELDFDFGITDDCDSEPTVVIDGPDDNQFPVGETEVTVTATDVTGNESSCTFTVTVEAADPPVITDLDASPNVLWPPNHRWVTVRLDAELEDESDNPCGGDIDWDIVDVESDEDDHGSSPDWQILDDTSLRLRAERLGSGNGREYTITLRAQNGVGEDERTVRVFVPHDQGNGRH